MSPEEFDDLVSLYLDDALPPERVDELNRILASEPDFAARFVRLGRIHGGLRELESIALAPSEAEGCPLPTLEIPSRPARVAALSWAPVGIAAVLLLSLVLMLSIPEAIQGPTVGRAGDPEILLVVGRADSLIPGDAAIRDRLVQLGFRVTPLKDSSTDLSKVDGKKLVVISESTISAELGNRLAGSPVPILNCEPNLNAALRITTRSARPDEVFLKDKQRSIRIVDPAHPLAGGLSGTIPIYSGRAGFVTWGVPDDAVARVIARCDTKDGEPSLFGYEPGKAARGADLPARRVSFFVSANTSEAERLTPEGWTLFDAAVRWLVSAK